MTSCVKHRNIHLFIRIMKQSRKQMRYPKASNSSVPLPVLHVKGVSTGDVLKSGFVTAMYEFEK